MQQCLHEFSVFLCEHLLSCELFLQSLLFECRLHLILVFNGLSPLLLLLGHALFITGSAHLTHLLLLSQTLLISLKLELNLILSSSLAHFGLILHGLALLLLLDL
jgi:hypothetical protein